MKSSLENLLSNQLEALLLPPEEGQYFWLIFLGIIVLVVSLSLLIRNRWQHRNTPSEIAKRQISALAQSVLAQRGEVHAKTIQQTAIELVSLLRKGLGIARLDEYKPLDLKSWTLFHTRLDSLCYSKSYSKRDSKSTSKQEGNKTSLKPFFDESLVWLSTNKE